MPASARPSTFSLTKDGPFRLYSTQELIALPSPTFLVDGVLPNRSLACLYSPPGAGKSFVAMDIAMSVATGIPWMGRSVEEGFSLYVVAEGGAGAGKRMKAWLHQRGVRADASRIAWLLQALPIYGGSESLEAVISLIHDEVGLVPNFVVIDTLARCFEGDENTQEDMGAFIRGADRLREEFDATVLILHHSRLDGARARGSTAFLGALDTMIGLDHNETTGITRLTCEKQKDFQEFPAIEMHRTPSLDSFVMTSLEVTENQDKLSRAEVLENVLLEIGPSTFTELRAEAKRVHLLGSTFKRALDDLVDLGRISHIGKMYAVN